MASLCYENLDAIETYVNNNFNGYSYDTICRLNQEGKLDNLLIEKDIYNCLKYELLIFLNILNNPVNNDRPYLRRLFLHESDLAKTFRNFGYILSLYVGDTNAYRVFPLFVQRAMEKYEMSGSEEVAQKVRKYMDLHCIYNPNLKKVVEELPNRHPNMFKNYDEFIEKFKNGILDQTDKDELSVAAEYFTYNSEYENLKKYKEYIPDVMVKWVAYEYGDGYGYDVLSYDPIAKKQKLIEVKSGASNFFTLTANELKKVYEAIELGCDYYIYRIFYDKELNATMITKMKFDPENNYFYDINNGENIYYLDIYFDVDDNGKEIVVRRINGDDYFELKYKENKN